MRLPVAVAPVKLPSDSVNEFSNCEVRDAVVWQALRHGDLESAARRLSVERHGRRQRDDAIALARRSGE